MRGVAAVDTFEAFRAAIAGVQRRLGAIEAIEILHPLLQADMGRVAQQVPTDTTFMAPFLPLADLSAHEQ